MPKVTIDHGTCIACGLCYGTNCPDVFEEGDDASSQLKATYRKDMGDPKTSPLYQGENPAKLMECAKQAAEDCPVSTIKVQ